jgi:hypothetical protein
MIDDIIDNMLITASKLKNAILLDIEDVKNANHSNLLERNSLKQDWMIQISQQKSELNQALANAINAGQDVNIYREKFNYLEENLRELYELNGKLGSIVLPVKEMYKEIVEEITQKNGGSIVEVRA